MTITAAPVHETGVRIGGHRTRLLQANHILTTTRCTKGGNGRRNLGEAGVEVAAGDRRGGVARERLRYGIPREATNSS